ncbi:MAG: hypothetical protein Kapaf2KO_13130 [Candidatus Kapaibacteriales bacterium]
MRAFKKIKLILALVLVILLIAMTNIIDRKNYEKIKNSTEEIYNDRVVAQDIIYKLAKSKVEFKELSQDKSAKKKTAYTYALFSQNDSLVSKFQDTQLTANEREALKGYANYMQEVKKLLLDSSDNDISASMVLQKLESAYVQLDNLANIQVKEARRKLAISEDALDTLDIFQQMETIILVLAGIIIILMIFYFPRQNSDIS